MKLLDVFKKKDEEDIKGKKTVDLKELEIYSGMRVMVETPEGQILFIGDLQDPYGGRARLCQCSGGEGIWSKKTVYESGRTHVMLRGYNNRNRKAVHMEGMITPEQNHMWQVEDLVVTTVENERTFYRLDTDIDGVIVVRTEEAVEEKPCKLLNISVGGASISSEYRCYKGDRFLLKVKLLENDSEMILYCEVLHLRMTETDQSGFEYGCQFLELAKADQEHIAQSMSAIEGKSE